jgi:hypothetical protein
MWPAEDVGQSCRLRRVNLGGLRCFYRLNTTAL